MSPKSHESANGKTLVYDHSRARKIMSLSLPKNVLGKYMNDMFIETGSHMGSGIQLALDLKFKTIHSIEKNNGFYQICKQRFQDKDNVLLHKGKSSEILPYILDCCVEDEKITFWLDAHIDPADMDAGIPLMQELEIIHKYYKFGDIILIDDRSQFGKHQDNFLQDAWTGVTEESVTEALIAIDPDFYIYYEDNKFRKNEIIVATLKRKKKRWVFV